VRNIVFIIFAFLLPISSYGQQDSTQYYNRDRICIGLNIGGIYPFCKKTIFNLSEPNYDLTNISTSKNGGISIGLNINSQSNRRKHFIAQLDLNCFFTTQHLKFYDYKFSHFIDDHQIGNFSFSNSGANISIIPEFIIGNKVKTFIGLGFYYSNSFNFNYKGQLETIGLKQLNDTLSPVGYYLKNDTIFYINNEIGKKLKANRNIGLVFNIGMEIPYKKKKVLIMARFYQSNTDYLKIIDMRQYMISISLTIPLNYK
jgi:hypothetical protein